MKEKLEKRQKNQRVIVVMLIAVLMFTGVSVAQAGYPVFVTNFLVLVQDYMKSLWDSVVNAYMEQWLELKEILMKPPTTATISELQQYIQKYENGFIGNNLLEIGNTVINSPDYKKAHSVLHGDRNSYVTERDNFLSEYERLGQDEPYLDFSKAGDESGAETLHKRVNIMAIAMAKPPIDDNMKKSLDKTQKAQLALEDARHQVQSQMMNLATSSYVFGEEMTEKYKELGKHVDDWDSAYSDQVIKELAKMQYDNLLINIHMLKLMSMARLNEAMQ